MNKDNKQITIKISTKNKKKLQDIRDKYKLRSLNVVIDFLLEESKEIYG